MKCFKMLGLIIGISVGIISVSSRNIASIDSDCNTAAWELLVEISNCAPRTFDTLDFARIIKQYTNHSINSTILSQSAIEYCDVLKAATTCSLGKMSNIQPMCRHTPLMERFMNLVRIVARLETEFCSEQIFYNIANDSGFRCLAISSFAECRHPPPALLESEFSLDDNNICATMKRFEACGTDIIEECQNDGQIKKYVEQAWNSLNDEFTCNNV